MMLTIARPDDWHLHLRDGAMMQAVLPFSAAHFGRAIVMPNLLPPVVRSEQARAYRERIMEALPAGQDFEPLMSLYLTEDSDAEDVARGVEAGVVKAVKLYPAGATTNSDSGVRDVARVMPVLERLALLGVPLLVHGEVTDPQVDIFDRERVFIDRVLAPLRQRLPELRVVLEHVTTQDGVDFVLAQAENVAATITPHHLVWNRNDLLVGGVRPHRFCLPVVKRERHRLALRRAATSGDARFFLGTDSAPHLDHDKESSCGCAGVFNAAGALSVYAQVFEEEGALEHLEGFASFHGPAFYRLPVNQGRLRLVKQEASLSLGGGVAVGEARVSLFDPGRDVFWRVEPVL